jgi:hypothetical protein
MTKVEEYRTRLRSLENWEVFLLEESGLPGPRGNIELARVVAEEGDRQLFERFLSFDSARAPTNSPLEFLAFCGVLGLGRLYAEEGRAEDLRRLRLLASDNRWRIREAVAMALQRTGAVCMDALVSEMEEWSRGSPLEARGAAAALCEPSLLGEARVVARVLCILDRVTCSLTRDDDRRSDDFRVLRKGLGYCWSVAVAACPTLGKPAMEKWFSSEHRDVIWVMRQNLGKKRLARVDPDWVAVWLHRMATPRH